MQENPYQDPLPATRKPSRLTRLSLVTGAGLLITLVAAGLGGAASAQTVIDDSSAPVEVLREPAGRIVHRAIQPGDDADHEMFESSPEDEAVWDQFEQCLNDAGLTEDDFDETNESAPDEATVDAAFEQCEPILDDLSGEFAEFGELSAADEGVFDQYDECLTTGGIDDLFEAEDDDGAEVDDTAIDALFEQCDPILDGLSVEAHELFGDFEELSAADEEVFDQYDECLTTGGIDDLFEAEDVDGAELDETAIDALFEQCDPILDGLSIEGQELFEDCPDDEVHEDLEDNEDDN